ncbi:MAG: hypothetical protein HY719_09895 [Planctomycetes bacterium]|nr:hypothetical protein [Planctomycetota bacterium]
MKRLLLSVLLLLLVAAGSAGYWFYSGGGVEENTPPTFPEGEVTLIVPAPKDSCLSHVARSLCPNLGGHLTVPLVTDESDRARGHYGVDGLALAASAPADGQTLLLLTEDVAIYPHVAALRERLPPDDKSCEVIAQIAASPLAVAVGKESAFQTLKDLVAAAKEREDLLIGYTRRYSITQVAALMLAEASGAPFDFQSNQTVADAIRGAMQGAERGQAAVVLPAGDLVAAVAKGDVRVLAVLAPARLDLWPAVPTAAEAGYEGLVAETWAAIALPRGVERVRVDLLRDAIRACVEEPPFRARLASQGFVPRWRDAAAVREQVEVESRRYAAVAKGIK